MNEKDISKVNNVVNQLKKIKQVIAIILFGSQVTGRARSDSDIDIAVIAKSKNERESELEIMSFSDGKIDISILHRLPLIIQFRVLRDGKILYCKNSKVLYNTKVNLFRNYLDFSSYMNGFYKRVIKHV
jgi:predicted nucleotidyltransferase